MKYSTKLVVDLVCQCQCEFSVYSRIGLGCYGDVPNAPFSFSIHSRHIGSTATATADLGIIDYYYMARISQSQIRSALAARRKKKASSVEVIPVTPDLVEKVSLLSSVDPAIDHSNSEIGSRCDKTKVPKST